MTKKLKTQAEVAVNGSTYLQSLAASVPWGDAVTPYGIERQQWAAVIGDVLLERGMPVEFVERVKMALDPETLMLPPDTVRQWLRLRAPGVGYMAPGNTSRPPQFEPVLTVDREVRDLLLRQVAAPIGVPRGSHEWVAAQYRADNAGLKP